MNGADLNQTTPAFTDLPPCTPETPPTPAEMDARLAQYEKRAEEDEEDEEEEERIPDLQKDDMMARRTGVFHKQSTSTATFNRFLPLPSTKRCTQGEVTTDAAPRNRREVQADRREKVNARWAENCVSNSVRRSTNTLGVVYIQKESLMFIQFKEFLS